MFDIDLVGESVFRVMLSRLPFCFSLKYDISIVSALSGFDLGRGIVFMSLINVNGYYIYRNLFIVCYSLFLIRLLYKY